MASQVKLTYFDIRALGETIRYLLSYADIDFEDVRVSFEEWPKLKSTTPLGQLPVYEEDGAAVSQSVAICRYIATKAKLLGDNAWENLQIDSVVDTLSELRLKLVTYYFEPNEQFKEYLMDGVLKQTLPLYMDRLETLAEKNSGYLAAGKLTWADLFFAAVVDVINFFSGADQLASRPNLKSLKTKVDNLPAIRSWIEKRPKTDF